MSLPSVARHPGRALLTLLAVCALALGFMAPAQAAKATGTITGTVKLADGQKLGYAFVMLYKLDDGYWDWVKEVELTKGKTDTYAFKKLAKGTYRVEVQAVEAVFVDDEQYSSYAGGVWDGDGKPLASFVEAGEDLVVEATNPDPANFLVTRGATISGTISGPSTADPDGNAGSEMDNIQITAYRLNPTSGDYEDAAYGYADEQGDGTYEVRGLLSGTYRLQYNDFEGNYLSEYYDDAATIDRAKNITVGEDEVATGIDATLTRAGGISGTVTAGSKKLRDIYVTAYTTDGEGGWDYASDTSTKKDGTYTVKGLAPGNYKVEFAPDSDAYGSKYARQVYKKDDDRGVTTLDKGSDVLVSGSQTNTDVDARLSAPGTITGSITVPPGAADGTALSVHAVDQASGEILSDTVAKKKGSKYVYSLKGLAQGDYVVEFARDFGRTTALGQFYNDVREERGRDAATPVSVTSGKTTPNVNAAIENDGGSITGTLLDQDGKPAKCFVTATSAAEDGTASPRFAESSAKDGTFTITGLSPATYLVTVESDPDSGCKVASGQKYRSFYFDDEADNGRLSEDRDAASSVTVTREQPSKQLPDLYFGATQKTFEKVDQPEVTADQAAVAGDVVTSRGSSRPEADSTTWKWSTGDDQRDHALTAADACKALTVTWTYSKDGYLTRSLASVPLKVGPLADTKPTITSDGNKLSVGGASWTSKSKLTYQWMREGQPITKATKVSYTKPADGARYSVQVTATKSGCGTSKIVVQEGQIF